MKKTLRVALVQINTTVGDLQGNCKKILSYIKKIKQKEIDIMVFPELAISGYPPEDLLLKRHFIEDNLKILKLIAEKSVGITAIVGFVDRDAEGNLYNAAAVIHKTKIAGIEHKIKLPNYGVFDEKRYFKAGQKILTFKLGEVIFGVNICEDIWRSKKIAKLQADGGAQVIINLSASPYYAQKGDLRRKILSKRAKETGAYICCNNLVGGQDELVFDGGSFVFNPQGEEIAFGEQFAEDLLIVDIDTKIVSQLSAKGNKSQANLIVLEEKKLTVKKTPLCIRRKKKQSHLEEIYNALILGTRDYLKKNNFQKAVLGLSGGIDSALVTLIAYDAIGKENVTAISMPSCYSSNVAQSDARILANNLGIKFISISIDNIFKDYLNLLKKEFLGLNSDTTEENLQARIRGNILMAFSNKFGWLVLTTGNKSETSVGYCTLYGDMAGGFAVIKDVSKTLVYKLTKFRDGKEKRELVPREILTREPSAELKQGQKDRDSLPPYAVLDAILKAYVEEHKNFEQIASEFCPETVKKIIQMVDKNEYKRRQSPPGIKITPRAFGRDRRFPIVNRYEEC